MTNPDLIFAKLIKGKALTKGQKCEVEKWENAEESDKIIAWCFLFLTEAKYAKEIISKLASILRSNDVAMLLNALVVLMYAPNQLLLSPSIKKAVQNAFVNGGRSVRLNASQVLAAQKDMGDAAAKKLLENSSNDPDRYVRDNVRILSRSK